MEEGKGIHCAYEPGTFRPLANKDNDYLIDRRAQKEKRAYSGVFGFAIQDASLQESMGPIQDHESEKLLPTDRAIVMARRLLYDAAVRSGERHRAAGARRKSAARSRRRRAARPGCSSRRIGPKMHLADGLNQPVYTL